MMAVTCKDPVGHAKLAKLDRDADYPGIYCINCGGEAAQLGIEYGQIVLVKNAGGKKYLAVEYEGKQRVVHSSEGQPTNGKWDVRLEPSERVDISVPKIIDALQKGEELLVLEK